MKGLVMKTRIYVLTMILFAFFVLSCSSQNAVPKNVIIVIGDGTGFNQLEAGSLYLHGENDALTVQNLPVKLAASTYSASGHGYNGEAVLLWHNTGKNIHILYSAA